METMSQFANEKDLWKARCLRFAAALVAVMKNIPDHEIQIEIGLPQEDCDRIAKARSDARSMLRIKNPSVPDTEIITNRVENLRRMEQISHDSYVSKEGYRMQREYGLTPNGNNINGRWVLRGPNKELIDFYYYRDDLLERHGFVFA